MRDDILLRMRATDAGLDRALPAVGAWLVFSAAGNLATVWIGGDGVVHLVCAAPAAVSSEVGELADVSAWPGALPAGAVAGWSCRGYKALDALCRRLAVLGHVLPDQPLHRFELNVEAALMAVGGERTTERVAEVRQRVGQELFRDALMRYWGGRCALSGISELALLRASHAKPWKDSTDAERLDVHNGLLLAVHLDAAFDAGLIGVGAQGEVLVSHRLGEVERRVVGVALPSAPLALRDGHRPYLAWHRSHVFHP